MSVNNHHLPAVRPSRVLFFMSLSGAPVTMDHLQELHDLFGWPTQTLKRKARELGINVEPGEKEAA